MLGDQCAPFVSPLNLFVVWHPDFDSASGSSFGGLEYANFIYRKFCRDATTAFDRGIGIPTFFRYKLTANGRPLEIPFHEAERNVVVVLTESNLVNDAEYKRYVRSISVNGVQHCRIFFFCMDRFGYGVDPSQDDRLYTSIYKIRHTDEAEGYELRCAQIERFLVRELCRSLLDIVPSYQVDKQTQLKGRAPLRMVLSYSQIDGYEQAKTVRMHTLGQNGLQDLVNVCDFRIAGTSRQEGLNHFDMNTALIVLNTDEYSYSERCKYEVKRAKERAASIVLVNDQLSGEKRSFPYLGNVPTLRWKHNPDIIIFVAMKQILQHRYAKMSMDKIKEAYEINESEYVFFSLGCAPELFHISRIKQLVNPRQNVLVLYPDPPLGNVENEILKSAQADWTWATPTTINRLNL